MNLTARFSPRGLLLLGLLTWVYWPTLTELYDTWTTHPEYSHGLLVPLFSLYLLWRMPANGLAVRPWPIVGFATLVVAIGLRLVGSATSFLPLEGLSLVGSMAALVMILTGKAGLKQYWQPLVFLLFMIPLPYEASRMMGAELQRVGTICTTFLLQCFGLPALADGNRILVENTTLNVVEACSGLRMLVTFVAFSVAAVFVMERHWVVKSLVLGSAIPIALVTNVLRITATGLAHVWMPDGDGKTRLLEFIHDFNGWMMMPIGLTFLMLELWLFKHLLIERPRGARPTVAAAPAATAKAAPKFVSVIRMPVAR